MLLIVATACSSVVVAPSLPADGEAETVFLVDITTIHTALALPAPDGSYDLWGFGDWGYMVEQRTGSGRSAWLALPFVTTRAALEKLAVAATDGASLRAETGAREVLRIEVGGEDARELRARLEASRVMSEIEVDGEDGYLFWPAEVRYSLWGLLGGVNCNGALVGWLRELGCEVPGRFPRWRGWELERRDPRAAP